MYDLSAKEAFNCFKVSILEKSVDAIMCVYIRLDSSVLKGRKHEVKDKE